METKKKAPRFWSVRNKIIVIIYLVMFPVLIATGVFMYQRNKKGVTSENTSRYQTSVTVLNDSLGYFEQDLLDIFTYVIVNNDVGRVLRSPLSLGSDDPLFWRSLSPMNFVTDMLNVKGDVRIFILYPENGLVPYYTSQDGSVMVKTIEDIRHLEVYKRAVKAKGDTVWEHVPAGAGGLFEKNQHDKIVLAREVFDASKKTKLGFMALCIDVAQYGQICQKSLLYPEDGIIILDGSYGEIARAGHVSDKVLAYIQNTQLNETLFSQKGEMVPVHDTYIFAEARSTDGWVFYLSPKAQWDAKILDELVQPFLLALALLISIWPVSILASKIISAPMMRLHTSMTQFKQGDFSQQVQVAGNDEISELSETFNSMVRDMKEMIDRNYVMVLREKESELNALQAQINPHFLYNTLDSLYWQAVEGEQDELAENILALSELFRLVLSSGQSEITVRQEIALVSSYLHIQKMRFSQKLDYSISVSEDMMQYSISKLILQPFVENAIVHGLERLDSWGGVQVRGELKDGMLHFVIADNGTGMTEERIAEILFDNEDTRYANQRVGHYAIRNVKERMMLRHGKNATLEIQSAPGEGTRVSIAIPAEKPNLS